MSIQTKISLMLMFYLVLVQFAIFTCLPSASAQTPIFSFSNQSTVIDENKFYDVYADIKNESPKPLGNIVVTAKFFDANGSEIGQYNASPATDHLNAAEVSPLEIQFLDAANSGRVANYSLSATGNPAEQTNATLKILSANFRLDLLGTFYVNIVAQNQGIYAANNTLAIVAIYDKDNKLLAIGKALAEATPGSSDVPASSTAPFGVAITDKLQTYKATHFTVQIVSDNSESSVVNVNTNSDGYNSSAGQSAPVSRCIIATAAFGSDISPQVQLLREFRDNVALRTFSGSSFMTVFNAWYYSFSPQVAAYERTAPWLQAAVRAFIEPLLGILTISKFIDVSLLGLVSPEAAIVMSGIIAATFIALVYFLPVVGIVSLSVRHRFKISIANVSRYLIGGWSLGLMATIFGLFFSIAVASMAGTALIVISSIATVIIGTIFVTRRGI